MNVRSVLLDTDVFSFFFKQDTRAKYYEQHLLDGQPCLSFQSVAELRYWAIIRRWGDKRRDILESAMRRCHVLPFDEQLCQCWAEVTAQCRNVGISIQCGDAWIAATALRYSIPLFTHNASHFRSVTGISIISQI